MRALTLLLCLAACGNEVGIRPAGAQATGPIGLSHVTTDNDTMSGSGTTPNPLGLEKVYTDGTSLSGDGVTTPIGTPLLAARMDVFGDCSDSNVTVSAGTTTLGRDMFYNNLTIDGTGTINPNGYRIFVCGTLTFNNTGRIARNGGAGSGITAGVANAATVLAGGGSGGIGGSTAGGAAGTGGAATGFMYRGCSVAVTAAGANGDPCAGGGGGSGTAGVGAVTIINTIVSANDGDIHAYRIAVEGRRRASSSLVGTAGGGGGGRGDAGAVSAGGGGGAGGGYVVVSARTIVPTACHASGCIQAVGGDGGNGGGAGNTGGGGGGGGGLIVLAWGVGTAPTMNADGGNGGTGFGTGTNGGSGGDGVTITYRIAL